MTSLKAMRGWLIAASLVLPQSAFAQNAINEPETPYIGITDAGVFCSRNNATGKMEAVETGISLTDGFPDTLRRDLNRISEQDKLNQAMFEVGKKVCSAAQGEGNIDITDLVRSKIKMVNNDLAPGM